MKALLLSAGRSLRAKPIRDKNFLNFCGKTLIEIQLDALQKAGFKEIIIAVSEYNRVEVEKIAESYGAEIIQQENLDEGMAGAILASKNLVAKESLFIVSGNDLVTEKAYESILKASASGADAYLLAYQVKDYFPGGYLKTEDKKILGIIEKPGTGNEPSNLVNIVLHFFRDPSELFKTLESIDSSKDDRYEVALDSLMQKQNFEAVPYDGFWQALKFPWHVLDLTSYFLQNLEAQIDASVQIADSAIIKGKVKIEAGAKIMDRAIIQGPAYIGKNTIIASNTLIRESIIGNDCVVGYASEISRSFIGANSWFHSNYVGDTVIGENNSFGAGAVCANLRLDEKPIGDSKRTKMGPVLGDNIRIGVNTSIMPGVKIGSNTMITSGLVISQDIEPNKFVSGKFHLEISENRAELDPDARNNMKKSLGKS